MRTFSEGFPLIATIACSSFAVVYSEQPDMRELGLDWRATEQVLAACGITCPVADHALFDTYVGFMLARGFLPLSTPEEKCA